MNRARYYTQLWRRTQQYKKQLKINWVAVGFELIGIILFIAIVILAGSEWLNG